MLPVLHGLTQFDPRGDSEREGARPYKEGLGAPKASPRSEWTKRGPALFRPVKARTDIAKGVAERGRIQC